MASYQPQVLITLINSLPTLKFRLRYSKVELAEGGMGEYAKKGCQQARNIVIKSVTKSHTIVWNQGPHEIE